MMAQIYRDFETNELICRIVGQFVGTECRVIMAANKAYLFTPIGEPYLVACQMRPRLTEHLRDYNGDLTELVISCES